MNDNFVGVIAKVTTTSEDVMQKVLESLMPYNLENEGNQNDE